MSRSFAPLLRSARPSAAPRTARLSRNGSTAAHVEEAAEHYPQEGFNAPFWWKLAVAGVAVAAWSRAAPVHFAPKAGEEDLEQQPWLTRYIAYNLNPTSDKWRERNEKHLELAKQAADDKLLFQEAEKSRMRRMRYPGAFGQASPNGIEVGSQADLSGLVIKSEKDDFAA
ncbi:hypothetical protein JCM10213_007339 [Rhodosporidiobolus nylandii]